MAGDEEAASGDLWRFVGEAAGETGVGLDLTSERGRDLGTTHPPPKAAGDASAGAWGAACGSVTSCVQPRTRTTADPGLGFVLVGQVDEEQMRGSSPKRRNRGAVTSFEDGEKGNGPSRMQASSRS